MTRYPNTAFFTQRLLEWYVPEDRPLPWKNESDPYRIWLSEIILQQTRVKQGIPYYERFIKAYPTVCDLARAPEDEVMKHWEGLGYYSRARNMMVAARTICHNYQGNFPNTYEDIRALKGVGDYTAAAIASFAFNLPHAVLDGNVYRVLARFFGIDQPTNTTQAKKLFTELAHQLLASNQADRYNQAIMDFGATLCTPKKPDCASCPLQTHCVAYQTSRVDQLPQRKPKAPRRIRYFHFLLFNYDNQIIIRRREKKDVWQKLYEFPLLETTQLLNEDQLIQELKHWPLAQNTTLTIREVSKPFRQLLSHQDIRARFFEIECSSPVQPPAETGKWISRNELSAYPFPRIIDWYLADNSLYLKL